MLFFKLFVYCLSRWWVDESALMFAICLEFDNMIYCKFSCPFFLYHQFARWLRRNDSNTQQLAESIVLALKRNVGLYVFCLVGAITHFRKMMMVEGVRKLSARQYISVMSSSEQRYCVRRPLCVNFQLNYSNCWEEVWKIQLDAVCFLNAMVMKLRLTTCWANCISYKSMFKQTLASYKNHIL